MLGWFEVFRTLPFHISITIFFLMVVFTIVALSAGCNVPRSNAPTRLEVDHSQVRFQVSARCLRIQKATLKNLVPTTITQNQDVQPGKTICVFQQAHAWEREQIAEKSMSSKQQVGYLQPSKASQSFPMPQKDQGYKHNRQGAGIPCRSKSWTIQTKRPCVATRLLAGFSKHTVPPAQMIRRIRMTVLSVFSMSRCCVYRFGNCWNHHDLMVFVDTTSEASEDYQKINPRFRDNSLLDLRTETTFSSPSGTSMSRDPVPRFTGTNEEQRIAMKPTDEWYFDLNTSLIARTNPPLEFKSNGFLLPDRRAVETPSAMSKPTDW